MSQAIVYLGFGGNIGDTRWIFRDAREALVERIGTCLGTSRLYRSEPMVKNDCSKEDYNSYLNAVASFSTSLPPQQILEHCRAVEVENGRVRTPENRWGSRTLDIDILFYEDMVIAEDELMIPHPLLHERDFVLRPLADINPFFIHPLKLKNVEELIAKLEVTGPHYITEVDTSTW